MKFKKILLDESLFDNDQNLTPMSDDSKVSALTDYDDEFISDELPSEDMKGPESGSDTAVTNLLIDAIHDEWEAISSYNSLIETLKYESVNNSDYESFISVLNEINSEENKHVGQLQEILQRLSPNAQYIDKGREEGKSQFNFTNGQLQVQSWEPKQQVADSGEVSGDSVCTLTDVDDDM